MIAIPLLLLAIYFWYSVIAEVLGLLVIGLRALIRWLRDR